MNESIVDEIESNLRKLTAMALSLEEERTKYRSALEAIVKMPIDLTEIPTGSAYNHGKAFQIAFEALT